MFSTAIWCQPFVVMEEGLIFREGESVCTRHAVAVAFCAFAPPAQAIIAPSRTTKWRPVATCGSRASVSTSSVNPAACRRRHRARGEVGDRRLRHKCGEVFNILCQHQQSWFNPTFLWVLTGVSRGESPDGARMGGGGQIVERGYPPHALGRAPPSRDPKLST